jgi:hypothetical protein
MEQQDVEMQTRSAALTEQQLEDIVVPATFSGDVINAVWVLRVSASWVKI